MGVGPHQRIYKTPDGELVDVLVPQEQGAFPGGHGQVGQLVVYLPTLDEHGAKITSQVVWDRVPDDWELIETTEEVFTGDDPGADRQASIDANQPGEATTQGLSEAPVPDVAPQEVAYDPADHNVEDVIEYAKTIDDAVVIAKIMEAEKDGKDRSTLIEALADRLLEIYAVEDPEHHGEPV